MSYLVDVSSARFVPQVWPTELMNQLSTHVILDPIGCLDSATDNRLSFGGQRSIRQTLRQTLASCLTAYSKGHAGRAARPRDLACTPQPNLASRRRLSDPTARKDNGSLNSILLDGCSLFHGGLYGEA